MEFEGGWKDSDPFDDPENQDKCIEALTVMMNKAYQRLMTDDKCTELASGMTDAIRQIVREELAVQQKPNRRRKS